MVNYGGYSGSDLVPSYAPWKIPDCACDSTPGRLCSFVLKAVCETNRVALAWELVFSSDALDVSRETLD